MQPTRAAIRKPTWLFAQPRCPYLVLLPVGFTLPLLLPAARCALTAPFHPYPIARRLGRFAFCGTIPGVAPAGRYPAPCFRGARTFLQQAQNCACQRPSNHLALVSLYSAIEVKKHPSTPFKVFGRHLAGSFRHFRPCYKSAQWRIACLLLLFDL